jgi:hypothetical protein
MGTVVDAYAPPDITRPEQLDSYEVGVDYGSVGMQLYIKKDGLASMLKRRNDAGQTTDVKLLKASWLAQQGYNHRANLPFRQELEKHEKEAFVSEEEIDVMLEDVEEAAGQKLLHRMLFPPILVLSYCWGSPAHPDPTGSLLAKLAPVLEWYLSERARAYDGHLSENRKERGVAARGEYKSHECGVFMDFYSLYQGERTPMEMKSFSRALGRMDEWYGHAGTVSLLMSETPLDWGHLAEERKYHMRGWCTFERTVSALAKPAYHLLDVGNFPRQFDGASGTITCGNSKHTQKWADQACPFAAKSRDMLAKQAEGVIGVHRGGTLGEIVRNSRPAPLAPGAPFAELIGTRAFSYDLDKGVISSLYDRVGLRVLGSSKNLNFYGVVGWEAGDFAQLGRTLGFCNELQVLGLGGMDMTPDQCAALFRVLAYDGALPKLRTLRLDSNKLGDVGSLCVAAALKSPGPCPRLAGPHGRIYFENNNATEKGKRALREACKTRRCLDVRL